MFLINEKLNREQLKGFYSTDYVLKFHLDEEKQKERLKKLLKFINLDKNDLMLDVGCRNGLLLDYIADKIGFYLLKQFPEHIAVRTAIESKTLLEKVGFKNIKIIYLPHYIKILSVFDFLKYTPFCGKYFKARLMIICQK